MSSSVIPARDFAAFSRAFLVSSMARCRFDSSSKASSFSIIAPIVVPCRAALIFNCWCRSSESVIVSLAIAPWYTTTPVHHYTTQFSVPRPRHSLSSPAPDYWKMRSALALLALLLLLSVAQACSPASVAAPSTAQEPTPTPTAVILVPPDVVCEWARVRSVTDGDTIRVDFEAGAKNQPVRYIGIDTPETRHPTLGVQPFGPEASKANATLVAGRRICLKRDVSELDRYDRLLRYI